MFKKYGIWILIGLAPVVYLGAYVAWRQMHLYESANWEGNSGSPRWKVHFGSSVPELGLSLLFGPVAMADMILNDVGISREDGRDLERVGLSLRSIHRRPSSDPKFRAVVAQLIREKGEVLAVIGLPDQIGPSYELFRTQAAFDQRLRALPPTSQLIVHADPQLPQRGAVDDAFIDQVIAEIYDGSDWVVICEPTADELANGAEMGTRSNELVQYKGKTHADLRAALQKCIGRPVAAGFQPHWFAAEGTGDTQAVVPNPDGTITCGNIQWHPPETYPGLERPGG